MPSGQTVLGSEFEEPILKSLDSDLSMYLENSARSRQLKRAGVGATERSREDKMFSPKRMLLIVPAIVAASLAFGSPASAGEEDCNWYGVMSAKQQQENEDKKCNFTGDEWSSDVKAQTAWCESVSADEWLARVKEREKMLAGCGG